MLTRTVKQICVQCHQTFDVLYKENGSYDYIDDPCECDACWKPVTLLNPSLSEWLESLKPKKQYRSIQDCLLDIHQGVIDRGELWEFPQEDLIDFLMEVFNKGILNDYLGIKR